MRESPREKNLCSQGISPREEEQSNRVVYDVRTKYSRDWVTAAKSPGEWHLGVEERAHEFKDPWRREHLRQSDLCRRQETAALRASNKRATFGIVMATADCEEYKMEMAERVTCFVPDEG